jgi:hypothetical protein
VLFRLHQGQDEFILIGHQREGILAACHEAFEPEEALEKGGEAAHIRGGQIEMFKLHWRHPFMLEEQAQMEPTIPGEPKARFPRTAGTVTSLVTASGRGSKEFPVIGNWPGLPSRPCLFRHLNCS